MSPDSDSIAKKDAINFGIVSLRGITFFIEL